jgi:hypothetical protein
MIHVRGRKCKYILSKCNLGNNAKGWTLKGANHVFFYPFIGCKMIIDNAKIIVILEGCIFCIM